MKTYLKGLTPEEIIKRLKNGEIIKFDGNNAVYIKMIDGIICRFYGDFYFIINGGFDNDGFYFETEEPFEIKEAGLYKTRDGKKVFVSCITNECLQPVTGVIQGENNTTSWYLSGEYEQADESPYDIISKWEDK